MQRSFYIVAEFDYKNIKALKILVFSQQMRQQNEETI